MQPNNKIKMISPQCRAILYKLLQENMPYWQIISNLFKGRLYVSACFPSTMTSIVMQNQKGLSNNNLNLKQVHQQTLPEPIDTLNKLCLW